MTGARKIHMDRKNQGQQQSTSDWPDLLGEMGNKRSTKECFKVGNLVAGVISSFGSSRNDLGWRE